MNSSNNCYTPGEHDGIFIQIGSNKLVFLDYTYFINRSISQYYTISENLVNSYDLEPMLTGTSNGNDLHSVYGGYGFIGIITALRQVYLAIQPSVYTGSENIDITDSQVPLSFPMKINSEIVLHPRAYDNAVFQMISCAANPAFRQNTTHGGQQIVQFHASTKACTSHCNCEIPNMYNKASVDILTADICNDICIKNRN